MNQTKGSIKSVIIDEQERSIDKCLIWFYNFPSAKIGLTDLAKSINSSKTTTKQIVDNLVKINFLNKEIIGKAWLLTANLKHTFFITKKIPYNLNMIYESGIVSSIYKKVPSPRAIILFGSYRFGTDIEGSDIDIAVEIMDKNEMKIEELGIIKNLGYRKDVRVNLHIFSRNKIDLNLFSNIANGIVLEGFLEVKK